MADRSISDDDICSSCRYCTYNPGDRSSCSKEWPGEVDADGYVVSCDYMSHADDIEPVPGVVIALDGECPSVYIRDSQGEVVMWNYDEIVEDPEAWTASLHAVALAASKGPAAVREFLENARNR